MHPFQNILKSAAGGNIGIAAQVDHLPVGGNGCQCHVVVGKGLDKVVVDLDILQQALALEVWIAVFVLPGNQAGDGGVAVANHPGRHTADGADHPAATDGNAMVEARDMAFDDHAPWRIGFRPAEGGKHGLQVSDVRGHAAALALREGFHRQWIAESVGGRSRRLFVDRQDLFGDGVAHHAYEAAGILLAVLDGRAQGAVELTGGTAE